MGRGAQIRGFRHVLMVPCIPSQSSKIWRAETYARTYRTGKYLDYYYAEGSTCMPGGSMLGMSTLVWGVRNSYVLVDPNNDIARTIIVVCVYRYAIYTNNDIISIPMSGISYPGVRAKRHRRIGKIASLRLRRRVTWFVEGLGFLWPVRR